MKQLLMPDLRTGTWSRLERDLFRVYLSNHEYGQMDEPWEPVSEVREIARYGNLQNRIDRLLKRDSPVHIFTFGGSMCFDGALDAVKNHYGDSVVVASSQFTHPQDFNAYAYRDRLAVVPMENLPSGWTNRFDLVLGFGMQLRSAFNPGLALEEAARIMKPGSIIDVGGGIYDAKGFWHLREGIEGEYLDVLQRHGVDFSEYRRQFLGHTDSTYTRFMDNRAMNFFHSFPDTMGRIASKTGALVFAEPALVSGYPLEAVKITGIVKPERAYNPDFN